MSLIKTRAIAIHTTRFSENSVILSCFTEHFGMQSYMINGVRSRKGSIRPSQLMPLTLLELEAYHQQNKNLQRIKELKCDPILNELHFHTLKSTIALFVAEILHRLIREENHTDEALFTFLYHAVQILDITDRHPSNFPVMFLTQLSRYLGFYPKGNYSETSNGFDLHEGTFTAYDVRNPYQLNPELSSYLSLFLQQPLDEFSEIPITYVNRKALLEHLIEYYKVQVQGNFELKSHLVLTEVLTDSFRTR